MQLDKEKLNRRLEEKAITAKELSAKKGIAYGSMLNAKNGKGVSAATVRKICEALGCEPKDLLPDIE